MSKKRSHTPVDGAEQVDTFDAADGGAAETESPDGVKVTRTDPLPDRAADDKPKPKFGTPVPAGAGALPRVVPELARAGRGETRYKVACRNYAPQKTRYVLAADGDEAGAIDCYLAANGLDKLLAKLRGRAKDPADVEAPDLVVTRLAD